MDNTSRMIALLGELRREMNGAVADGMRFYGRDYGLNYGVSLPTIRSIARAHGRDHAFAEYLYVQDVRELRLAALHVADPSAVRAESLPFWAAGMVNSEVAEEAAFALFGSSPALAGIFGAWIGSDDELAAYAALMSAARGGAAAVGGGVFDGAVSAVARHPDSRLVAQGAVALLGGAFENDASSRDAVRAAVAAMPRCAAADYVADEMEWRMETV